MTLLHWHPVAFLVSADELKIKLQRFRLWGTSILIIILPGVQGQNAERKCQPRYIIGLFIFPINIYYPGYRHFGASGLH